MADRKPLKLGADGATLTQFQTGDSLAVEFGGTSANTASDARTNLGLAIGSDVQAYDADLAALAGLSTTGFPARTGAGTWALRDFTVASTARLTITNSAGVAGNPTLDLATVADGGGGTLSKFTKDSYGRITGTSLVTTSDLTALLNATYAPINNPTFTGTVTLPGDPASALQAATKQYVDSVAAGAGNAPWTAVRAVSTSNITLSGAQTIDGVSLVAGNRVLVAGQTTTSANGIYLVAAGAWTRATDADASDEFAPGRQVFVEGGTAYDNSGWAYIGAASPTLGTTAITFTQVSGLGQITAGAGLTKTGNTIDVGTASSSRIVVNADNIDLAASGVGSGGTYTKVTVDTYGRVTAGATATAADVGAQASDATLTALAAYNTNGLLTQTAADTFTGRTITGTSGRITVTNGNGVSGNPTIDLNTTGVGAGTYNSVTVDTYGRVTAGSNTAIEYTAASLTNGEASAIAIGRAVYPSASGAVKLATANAAGTKDVIGLVMATSIASSVAGPVATSGTVTATTTQWDAVTGQTGGLTFGARYYLSNTTAGALTTTPPTSGYVIQVGVALSTTKLALNIGPVIQL